MSMTSTTTKMAPMAALAAVLLVAGVMLTRTMLLPRLSEEAAATPIQSSRRSLLHLEGLPVHATTTRQMLQATPELTAKMVSLNGRRSLRNYVNFRVQNDDGVPCTLQLRWYSVPNSNKSPTECNSNIDATSGLDNYPGDPTWVATGCKMDYYGQFRVVLTLVNALGDTIDEKSLPFLVSGEPLLNNPDGFAYNTVLEDFKYYVSIKGMPWDQCWATCQTIPGGAVPAIIGNPTVNSFLSKSINEDSPLMSSTFWLGGKYVAGHWYWGSDATSDPKVTWFDWIASPRTGGGGVGISRSGTQCLALETEPEGQTGTWKKGQCSASRQCLCQGPIINVIPQFP